jgi:hypothetical protein
VRRREFIALLGGAAICAPLAARVFVFASGLAASAWHAHVNKLRWPKNNTSGFAPVLVLPVLSFQLAFYWNPIRRSSLGGVEKFADSRRASSLVGRLAAERRPGSSLK